MFNIEGFSAVKEEILEEVFGGGYYSYILSQAIDNGAEIHVITTFESTQTNSGTTFTQTTTVSSQGVTGKFATTGNSNSTSTTVSYSAGNS